MFDVLEDSYDLYTQIHSYFPGLLHLHWDNRRIALGPLLLTWFNFNPSMDK